MRLSLATFLRKTMAGAKAFQGLTVASFVLLVILIVLGYATAGTEVFVLIASILVLDLGVFAFGLYVTQSG